jgi:hypothetical protein
MPDTKPTMTFFSAEQQSDWEKAQELLRKHGCKCGVCAANLYLKIRSQRQKQEEARNA